MNHRVVVLGMSHKSAPVEVREKLAISEESAVEAMHELTALKDIDEAVVISTCNRVEVVVGSSNADSAAATLRHYLSRRADADPAWLERYVYCYEGDAGIQHLFRVAGSLDSLVVGEPQILGQVKSAFRVGTECGTVGKLLTRTFDHALKTAKRVRTETAIAENAVSISYAAVELAKKVFGRLDGKGVTVVGAGKMGALALRHLRETGVHRVDIVNRSLQRAESLAADIGGLAHPMTELPALLESTDIVITSTGSQHYVVTRDMVRDAMRRRRQRPLFLVDIAVPRDIDPRCDGLPNVYLFDVDDLGKVVEANLRTRIAEASKAETIIREEAAHLSRWISSHEAVPTIVMLRRKLNQVKDAEVARLVRNNPNLDPEAREVAERLAVSLVNKILHDPTISLREAPDATRSSLIRAARSLFRLAESERSSDGNSELTTEEN